MKTNSTIRHMLLAFTLIIGMASCKKDKKEPEPVPPVEVTSMTFAEVKALSTGASVKVPDARKIKGIVVSDVNAKNIDSKTVILQEAADKPGIIITFDAAQAFVLNDEIEVTISNQTLAQLDGEVVLQNIPAANAKKTGTGAITAKETTIANILTNKTALNGTLVKINATELTGGNGKYTGTLNIKDASGELTTQIQTNASFAGDDLPPSVSAVTGIVRINGTNTRLDIRKADDIVVGDITRVLTESFENITESADAISKGLLGFLNLKFTTSLGEWATAGSTQQKHLGSLLDGSFTTQGREYVYDWYSNDKNASNFPNTLIGLTKYHLISNMSNTAGLKTVTITFAASTADKLPYLGARPVVEYPVLNLFNEQTDVVQIAIYPARKRATQSNPVLKQTVGGGTGVSEQLLKISPEYKKTGEFYTFTYKYPTKDELIAAGVSERDADECIASPEIVIYNLSTRNTGTNSKNYAPILFDKVVFGF